MVKDEKLLQAHLFICTNKRAAGSDCASKGSEQLLENSKTAAKSRWGKGIRVNRAGCLGHCERGIAAVCYPSATWLLELEVDNSDVILNAIEQQLLENNQNKESK